MSSYQPPPPGDIPPPTSNVPVGGIVVIGSYEQNSISGLQFDVYNYGPGSYAPNSGQYAWAGGGSVVAQNPAGSTSHDQMTINVQTSNIAAGQAAAILVGEAGATILNDLGLHPASEAVQTTNGSFSWGQAQSAFATTQFVVTDDVNLTGGNTAQLFRQGGQFVDYIDVRAFSAGGTFANSSVADVVGVLLHEFGHEFDGGWASTQANFSFWRQEGNQTAPASSYNNSVFFTNNEKFADENARDLGSLFPSGDYGSRVNDVAGYGALDPHDMYVTWYNSVHGGGMHNNVMHPSHDIISV